ncbi:hypothetical protein V6N11_067780 [Hibiscus sabdariffa]|uniref:Uncharacterized protein n=1 Tax=Hibiscus sabdariffa TaxID=183260 RepID=A0ABR2SRR9_9ROSI
MRFSIFCWLLWKARCSEILGDNRAACESLLVRGQQLIDECERVFAPTPTMSFSEMSSVVLWTGPDAGWVKGNVDAVVKPMEECAAIGGLPRHALNWNGSLFAVPPGIVVVMVEEDKAIWANSGNREMATPVVAGERISVATS